MDRNLRSYAALMAVQTACAAVMLANIHAVFRILIENIGVPNSSPPEILLRMLIAAAVGQICYWRRLLRVPIPTGYRNVALGHLLAFSSRLGFIFGGALFSAYFLRHAPLLDLGVLEIAWRSAGLIGILFSLYCYTLELERLGGAFQLPPKLPS